jgi:hypothetical protein
MGAGASIPTLLRRAVCLTAVALPASCWPAVPAYATDVLADGQVPTPDPSVVTATATEGLAAAEAAAKEAVPPASEATSALKRPVADAAAAAAGAAPAVDQVEETAVALGASPPPAPDAAAGTVDRAGPPGPAIRSAAKPPARQQVRGAGREPARSPRSQPERSAVRPPSDLTLPAAPSADHRAGTQLAAGPASPAQPANALGGASVAATSAGLALGGLAVLLALLSLAGPALRRRLPSCPAACLSAAFVPLLERPG